MIALRSRSSEETERLGEAVGRVCAPGTVIAFTGSLAAGKTTMAKGIARALGIIEPILSPTFTLINDYPGDVVLHHMDAYRLGGERDFLALGADEIMADGGVSLIEWSERVEAALPPGHSRIGLRVIADDERVIEIEGPIEASLRAGNGLAGFTPIEAERTAETGQRP